MTTAMLFQLEQATLGYDQQPILQAVDLQINRGDRVALLGASGSGKTTLLRHLRKQRLHDVAWCPQQSALVPMLTVFHNIAMGRLDQHSTLYNVLSLLYPFARQRREVAATAALVDMEKYLFTAIEKLSGGQQSRTNLARALFQQRPIFLGDEPVSAVDELQADQLLQLICARHETVVLALHDVELALRHCSRIIGLRDGVIELNQPASQCSTSTLCELYASS